MKKIVTTPLFLISFLVVTITLTSCSSSIKSGFFATRHETALKIASSVHMQKRKINAEPYIITVFERIKEPGKPAHIYIEGDGMAWASKTRPSLDPTPTDPVALRLATLDDASNVVYMARPCQYSKMSEPVPCSIEDWTSKRFSPNIINSMNAALSEVASRYSLRGLHLIGFSGGATIAAFMAAERDDVMSFRSVGGNLDHATINRYHKVSQLNGSLNAVQAAPKLYNMPQHHFIGSKDKIIPLSALDSYTNAVGPTSCLRSTIIKGAGHEDGWGSRWAHILKEPVDCNARN
jgi:hypothetical protein